MSLAFAIPFTAIPMRFAIRVLGPLSALLFVAGSEPAPDDFDTFVVAPDMDVVDE